MVRPRRTHRVHIDLRHVDASRDHGLTFPEVTSLVPPDPKNWGDRDFIAVGPDGTVYLTYDYGSTRTTVTFICSASGSCGYSTGDVNVVLQKSTDGGSTWDWPPFGSASVQTGAADMRYQGSTLYIANESGVWSTDDDGDTATDRNTPSPVPGKPWTRARCVI